jgi:hypothetical protein
MKKLVLFLIASAVVFLLGNLPSIVHYGACWKCGVGPGG